MDYAQYNRITYAVADPEIWDGAGRECRAVSYTHLTLPTNREV